MVKEDEKQFELSAEEVMAEAEAEAGAAAEAEQEGEEEEEEEDDDGDLPELDSDSQGETTDEEDEDALLALEIAGPEPVQEAGGGAAASRKKAAASVPLGNNCEHGLTAARRMAQAEIDTPEDTAERNALRVKFKPVRATVERQKDWKPAHGGDWHTDKGIGKAAARNKEAEVSPQELSAEERERFSTMWLAGVKVEQQVLPFEKDVEKLLADEKLLESGKFPEALASTWIQYFGCDPPPTFADEQFKRIVGNYGEDSKSVIKMLGMCPKLSKTCASTHPPSHPCAYPPRR
eukprot:COSAG04_NODE_4692_length_1946_cov_1.295073_1_plen_291_part_00